MRLHARHDEVHASHEAASSDTAAEGVRCGHMTTHKRQCLVAAISTMCYQVQAYTSSTAALFQHGPHAHLSRRA